MKLAVIDDDKMQQMMTCRLIEQYCGEKGITIEKDVFSDGESFLAAFENGGFDAVFLDIYMDGVSGIDVAKEITERDRSCLIIFFTSSSSHMPDAFRFHAFEYIEKPASKERVFSVMDELSERLVPDEKHLEFEYQRRKIMIKVSCIMAIETEGHNVVVYDNENRQHRTRSSLTQFMEKIGNDGRFLPINRGIMVNMDYITDISDGICTAGGLKFSVKVRGQLALVNEWQKYVFENKNR